MKSISLFAPLLAAALVSAHGYVSLVTIDGKQFKGNNPGGDKGPSIVRKISDPSPVKGANNPAVNCGPDAGPASDMGTANPGSVIAFSWNGEDGSNWPHNTGPMLTYMASCGSTPCNKFDSSSAKWFKIDQVGRNSKGAWVQADLMAGKSAPVTLPKNLAPGNYLIRHEIIALHLANSKGGAEFYPSCSQITVTGDQKGAPSASELVALPGAYKDSDPGIFDPTVFDPASKYVFPGPPVASFISSGASAGGGDDSTPSPAPPAGKPKPTGSCSLKKNPKAASAVAAVNTPRPRHLSRVMRGLSLGHSH